MKRAVLLLAAFVGVGCSSVGASAVHTGPLRLPPHQGPVMVFAATQPANGNELGVVEVHASQAEGALENLMPLFVEKVAQLGGNAAVIDSVRANFEIVANPYAETYVYPCGFRSQCIGHHVYATNDEVMVVTIRGRAFAVPVVGQAPSAPPSDRPRLTPEESAP
jgi:hypothetical protein